MDFTMLGRTGLRVSRMGLGCGGHSRLGLAQGNTVENAVSIVRTALDSGVNFIDTAEGYGTEEAVGEAISTYPRESIVLSTKISPRPKGSFSNVAEARDRIEACLKRLRTDYVDVMNLHGVTVDEYAHARNILYPLLHEMKAEGKLRHIGITEAFIPDSGHRMLAPAVEEGPWEVVMVGFSLINPSARHRVLPATQARGIGTLCMFAVRRALSNAKALESLIAKMAEEGNEAAAALPKVDPLGFLHAPGVALNLQEAAYRFCLGEPGIDVVLSGTGNVEHLKENLRSMEGDRLPQPILDRIEAIFGRVDHLSGN